jgi:membrane protein YqaA with SNARE-associated domain
VAERNIVKKTYDWVLHWAETPYGPLALFVLAFAESSFFPVPPDVLLIALSLGAPVRSFHFAGICTLGSVLGGIAGYAIGMVFFDQIGYKILDFYGFFDKFAEVQALYLKYDALCVAVAGFTPVPYKVFTIASGIFGMNFPIFVVVSALTRGARFYIVSALIWKFGIPIKNFIDRYFNLLTVVFVVLLVLGFVLVKMFF